MSLLTNKLVFPFYEAFVRARGYYTATIGGHQYRLDPYHVKFWRRAAKGRWEPETFDVLSRFLDKDSTYCDVGAWIGPTVLHASKICKKVVCFEPDPTAYRYLRWNLDLNRCENVTSFNLALSDEMKVASMASFGSGLGDSMSSLLCNGSEGSVVDVMKIPWAQFLEASGMEKVDLLKIDIEGGEFALLPTLKDYLLKFKPTLYLSTHAPFLEESERKEMMTKVLDVVSIYKTCLNEGVKPIEFEELVSEKYLNEFGAFVFKD